MRATVTITDDDGKVIVKNRIIEPIEAVVTPVECIMDPDSLFPYKTTWFKFGVTEYMNIDKGRIENDNPIFHLTIDGAYVDAIKK